MCTAIISPTAPKVSPRRVAAATQRTSSSLYEQHYTPEGAEVGHGRCTSSFRASLVGTIVISTCLSCFGLMVPLELYKSDLEDYMKSKISRTGQIHGELISNLVNENVTAQAYLHTLISVRSTVESHVKDNVDNYLDLLWTYMQHRHRMTPGWSGKSWPERLDLANNSYLILSRRQRLIEDKHGAQDFRKPNPYSLWIKASWQSGQQVACSTNYTSDDSDGRMAMFAYDMPGEGDSTRTKWEVDPATGSRLEPPVGTQQHNLFEHPGFLTQALEARKAAGSPHRVPVRRLWSPLFYFFDDYKLGLSLTAPVAYCGDLSCYDGTLEVSITLKYISFYCDREWKSLQRLLAMPMYEFPIDKSNSSVFIVKHVSHGSPDQQGLLIGAANFHLDKMALATDETLPVIQATAKALKLLYGAWDAPALQESEQIFTFSPAAVQSGTVGTCEGPRGGCMKAGTLSVQLDEATRWLVVVVMPAGAFSKAAQQAEEEVTQEVNSINQGLSERVGEVRGFGFMIFAGSMFACGSVACAMSFLISRRLSALANLMRRLSDLDFGCGSEEALQLRSGSRSRIAEVGNIQDAFCRLAYGVEAFAKFVPEVVVQRIVQGDPRARALHVNRRHVSIMFTDIRDFTSISESMKDRDLLVLLTRYFSAMTQVVEDHEGVVAEILGDGLLVFWNTPGDVEEHALKACNAALAQMTALEQLNQESPDEMPHLYIRIGLHTGSVLSGNIGSEIKMKFGCMGDPVNTASRLEGLCKVYGVVALCSRAVCDALPAHSGLVFRKLDVVQVKGKQKATEIYELLGEEMSVSEADCIRAQRYEAALAVYQEARFSEAATMLRAHLDDAPGDAAAERLLDLAVVAAADASQGLAEWTGISAMNEK